MLSRQIQVGLVDDHALFRKTLESYLCYQDNVNVTVQAADVYDLLKMPRTSSIEILLMDIFMPDQDGIAAVRAIRKEYPDIKVLILSMCGDIDLISDLLEEGIHGYISKSDEPEELMMAIQAASENRLYRSNLLTEALYWNKRNNTRSYIESSQVLLSDRDKKILQLIWEEKSNKEIANELFLGIRSVEKIRQDLKEKIGVKSTVGMLKYALHKRFISIHSSVIN